MQCLLFPASRRAPKETLFYSLRCAGLENRPLFIPCVAQGSERDPFLLPALRRARKRPFFASCVAQGSERDPFSSPALRRARKRPFFAPCVAQGPKTDPFLLPALRRAPKETPFCSLRCAGHRKTMLFSPAQTKKACRPSRPARFQACYR